MNNKDNIMVIVAHPDDEVLGCGATIAQLANEGNNVYTLILGEGITARDEKRNRIIREEEIKELKKQMMSANKILGVIKTHTFDFPDNRFDTIPLLDIIKVIEKVKNDIRPDIIFTHHHGDLNIDHQITFKAVMTAFRPQLDEKVREIYSFEVPSSTEWGSESFTPNCYFSLRKRALDLKVEAMKCYKGELRKFPHPRSPDAIEVLASYRGINCGNKFAESFQTIRIVKNI